MWYLQNPKTDEIEGYVEYMSNKIKNSRHYDYFRDKLERNRRGEVIYYVDILLRADPDRQRKLNKCLMKRIFGKKYQEKHLRRLTQICVKKSKKIKLETYEKHLYKTYYQKVDKLRKLFNYDSWISGDKDYSYKLAAIKKSNVCPYCNRQYILTIEKKNAGDKVVKHIARPHFDHWYPKEIFPLLALSFYNLVPSCSVCNSSIKGTNVMGSRKYIHPYAQQIGYEPSFKFRVIYRSDKDFSLYTTIPKDKREKNMLNAFHLNDVYKYHERLEVEDLVLLQRAHSDTYLTKLMATIFRDLSPKMNIREVIRMIFGVETNAAHLNDRPMSKLKKDILEQFRIIDEQGNIHPDLLKIGSKI